MTLAGSAVASSSDLMRCRETVIPTMTALTGTIEAGLAPAAESGSQLAMMFAVCVPGLNRETHVTLILRWL
jgi:hypothetical protein